MRKSISQWKADYEELFKKNYSRMFYCALDIVDDAEAAKDIVGDACCETWRRMAEITSSDPDVNLAGYMLSSVRNRALNHLKRRAVENAYLSEALRVRQTLAAESAEAHEERVARLWQVMEGLTPQTRRVFEMCWFDGYKYQQAADELGVSVSAVHKHVSKAFAAFRKAFGVKISSAEVTILIVSLLLI